MRRSLYAMAIVVLGLHALGLLLLFSSRSDALLIGTGLTAYTLGLRHAFDADHIAAIDNATRKLMAEGKRPTSVGFWFSLGHASVVLAFTLLLALGSSSLGAQARNSGSRLHEVTSVIGTSVSGGFLYLIAAMNLAVLLGIVKLLRGRCDEHALEAQLSSRGPMSRLTRRFTAMIAKPWQMYPVGLLFGLGFDTASEVALLFLAIGALGAGLPFYAILCLPVLFAAGMSLLDTLDGTFMSFAYGWAFADPARRLFYNVVVTALSVVVALVIGTIELGGLLARKLGADGPFWTWLERVNAASFGVIVVGLFVLTWLVALSVWRFGHVEARWDSQ